jgi:solute:Na+ symporter, SSS family
LTSPSGIALAAFVVAMFAIAFWARGRIHDVEDYLVAGRRLSWPLATATLFATWFGAGTLLTATDEVSLEGLRAAALEPIGPGLCLILAGLFFAQRLWQMKLITLPDFYRRRFGPRAEIVSSLIMIPGYFGWIAAQFVALAGILEVFWQIPIAHGIWVVAAVGTGYTLLGGMWSVTLTDVVQVVLLLAGLVVLAVIVGAELSGGEGIGAAIARFVGGVPEEQLVLVPLESAGALIGWLSVLAVGALGNIPGQDLAQRIFAARSARIAVSACIVAGVLYVVFGLIPVMTGLSAQLLEIEVGERAILPVIATALMSPLVSTVFVLAIVAAVMSTIDSAILAPSSVLSNNLLAKLWPNSSGITLGRWAVFAVALASVLFSYLGQTAYELLETAYAIGMVGLFVPLALGLYSQRGGEGAALAAMIGGTAVWLVHLMLGWDYFAEPWLGTLQLPQELVATLIAWIVYELSASGAAGGSEDQRTGSATHQAGVISSTLGK